MKTSRNTRISQWIRTLNRVRADMQYAQTRVFENQTGVSVRKSRPRSF